MKCLTTPDTQADSVSPAPPRREISHPVKYQTGEIPDHAKWIAAQPLLQQARPLPPRSQAAAAQTKPTRPIAAPVRVSPEREFRPRTTPKFRAQRARAPSGLERHSRALQAARCRSSTPPSCPKEIRSALPRSPPERPARVKSRAQYRVTRDAGFQSRPSHARSPHHRLASSSTPPRIKSAPETASSFLPKKASLGSS